MRKVSILKIKQSSLRKLAKGVTQARIGLLKSGSSLNTEELVKFNLDHAFARDSVHAIWNTKSMVEACEKIGIKTLSLETKASSREEYITNPNSGCYLSKDSEEKILGLNQKYDVTIAVTNGLSTFAVEKNFVPFLKKFYTKLQSYELTISPIIFAPNGRVALSDQLGICFESTFSIICVGERPGLSAVDSMGIYFTYEPKINKNNSDRNCISNIRPPYGLSYTEASDQLIQLIQESLKCGFSGSNLKLK